VSYTVTAEDASTRVYTVTVTAAPPDVVPNHFVDQDSTAASPDGHSAATAWTTLAQMSGHAFAPSDVIGLKRGGVWHEALAVPSSGASGQPITYGAYGATGAAPVITGFTTIAAWTDEGGGVYSPRDADPSN